MRYKHCSKPMFFHVMVDFQGYNIVCELQPRADCIVGDVVGLTECWSKRTLSDAACTTQLLLLLLLRISSCVDIDNRRLLLQLVVGG